MRHARFGEDQLQVERPKPSQTCQSETSIPPAGNCGCVVITIRQRDPFGSMHSGGWKIKCLLRLLMSLVVGNVASKPGHVTGGVEESKATKHTARPGSKYSRKYRKPKPCPVVHSPATPA